MARVLLVSKFSKFQGGVERHVYDLMSGLVGRGNEVKFFSSEDVEAAGGTAFSASSSGLARAKSAQVLLWNSRARTMLQQVIAEFQPDVVHYHSISHQLSPSVLGAFGVPTVMTLHDYKLSAPCYTLYRDGEVCQACVGKRFATPAIRYKCVSKSAAASTLCATEDLIHRSRHRSMVGRFIVPSQFAFDVAIRGGLPAEKVSIVPWGVTAVSGEASPHESNVAFFGGRLHRTKGLEVLLDAWQSLPPKHGCVLRIAGEGELEPLVRQAASTNPTVQFLGMLRVEDVLAEVRGAAIAAVPSLFPETMGLSALEALLSGTPILASRRGALADLSGPGVWTLPTVDIPAVRTALVALLLEGQSEVYRQELSNRNLSLYRVERMIDAVEAVYRRAADEYRLSP